MVGRRDDYCGNILLYDYILTRRNPVFLNRNLTKALRIHEHTLKHGSTDPMPELSNEFCSRSKWRPPSWDKLGAMIESEQTKGTFTLDIHGLKPINTNTGVWTEPARKRRPLFRLKCHVRTTIWNSSTNTICKRKTDSYAELRGDQDEHGAKISITTQRITVTPDELAADDDTTPWRLNIAEAYHMLLSINLTDEDAKALYSYVAPHALAFDNVPSRLSISSPNILHCPEGPEIFPIRIGNQLSDFGLELSMYWTNSNSARDGSFLAAHNRELFEQAAYPTPPPREPSANPVTFALTFVYADELVTRSGLVCPHEQCRRRKITSIGDLRMHLDSWHDNFKYRVTNEGAHAGVEHWTFECDVADHKADQRASDKAPELRDVLIISPEDLSFDQCKYLDEGIEEYQRISRLEKSERQQPQGSPDPSLLTARRKNPEEVQPIPARVVKRFPVPRAPRGVTFFRSLTKRPLEEGEYISESDDDIETTWVDQRKMKAIERDNSISEPAKRFLNRYDPFIQRERIQGDVHAGDAMVRFVRENGAWLWDNQVYDEFKRKIDELLEDDIISKEVHVGCLQIVDEQKPTQKPTCKPDSGIRKEKEKWKGKARSTNDGHFTPQTADSDGDVEMSDTVARDTAMPRIEQLHIEDFTLPYSKCLCGHDAMASLSRPKELIACSNLDCIRSFFHIACIMEHWKPVQPPDPKAGPWICDECMAEGEIIPAA